MRREFSESTKRILAARVAYRCSCPGCSRITIGPSNEKNDQVINLGEAAHIYAASDNGPRSNPTLTNEQIVSIDNGIWLCRHHGRMIDADQINYSAETLQQWKALAEQTTYTNLQNLEKDAVILPQTLISLSPHIIFSGTWLSVMDDTWRFGVAHFIEGDITSLRGYSIEFDKMQPWERFVAIESQGDGRQLQSISWQTDANNKLEISCQVLPKSARTDPDKYGGDLGLGDDLDLEIKDGDFTEVKGVDSALQTMRVVLSSGFGDFYSAPQVGSAFSHYYAKYNDNPTLLNRLIKLEIIRLLSVETPDSISQKNSPDFNFINRVLDANLLETSVAAKTVSVQLTLEWGNNKQWEGVLLLHPRSPSEENETFADIEALLRNLLDGSIDDSSFPFKIP
jgi:hypothetical protein